MSVARNIFVRCSCLAAWLLIAAGLSAAQTPALTRLEVTIILAEDGSAIVIEDAQSTTVLAPYERRIPVRFQSLLGRRTLLVDVLEVKDSTGRPLPYHVRHAGDYLVIEAPSAPQELKLVYSIRNAVRFSERRDDEFAWLVKPPEASVGTTAVRVLLPAVLDGHFTAHAVWRMDAESPESAPLLPGLNLPVEVGQAEITIAAPRPLPFGSTLVVDVLASPGFFKPPGRLTRMFWFVQNNPIVFLPVFALAVMLVLRRLRGGNIDPGRVIAPMYEPPEGLTPAECGTLVADTLEPSGVTATLVDLAGRGYVQIEDVLPQPESTAHQHDFKFTLLKPRAEWDGLAAHEQTMLLHTFYGGHWTLLSSLRLRFPDIVPIMRSEVISSLVQKGMYRFDPEQAQPWRQVGLGVTAALLIGLQRLAGVEVFATPLLAALMIALAALIVYWLGRDLSAKTARGMKAYISLLGLREFISKVEAERTAQLGAGAFDKLLPYAMALGVEHQLARAFEGIAATAPSWYSWSEADILSPLALGQRMNRWL
ncbi:MAG: hypothetical protein ABSD20_04245 [Terriglobales bacterium]|jgi:hypothetical protein